MSAIAIPTTRTMSAVEHLRSRVRGTVVAPGDERYDAERVAWSLLADQRPAAIVLATTERDVVDTVRVAAEHGMRVSAQGTGHGAMSLDWPDGVILVKTSGMRRVSIDAQARRARVAAGAQWSDVTVPAGEHGLAALAGSAPDVGVVGYTLGGGMSWLGRRHGLASESVAAVELVTADGTLRRVSSTSEPDLFWAVRGGGGSFGIVTAIELDLLPVRDAYAGVLFFPMERAAEVLHAWRRWTATVPDEVTSVGRLLRVPPAPHVPEPLRGRAFAVVEAAMLLDERAGAALLTPLRDLGPEVDTFATVPAPALSRLHMDPPAPVPGSGDGMLLADLPPAAIDALVAAAGHGSGSSLLSVEVRQLGGAFARRRAGAGALGAVESPWATFAVGAVPAPEVRPVVEADLASVRRALAGWDSGRSFMNLSARPTDPAALFGAAALRRLQDVKRAYDPAGMMLANHPVSTA